MNDKEGKDWTVDLTGTNKCKLEQVTVLTTLTPTLFPKS